MPELVFYNSLSRQKEAFIPIDTNNVRLYVCGPTVYARPHLGNARSIVIYDLVYRLLKRLYPKVTYVRNITDIDDKIINRAVEEKVSAKDLAEKIIKEFYSDTDALRVKRPDHEPRATDSLASIIEMIEKLLANGNAYISEGHVLFSTKTFAQYGDLSGKNLEKNVQGARIEVADYKRDPEDFVLWKPAKDGDDQTASFLSPFGVGRPGWHIECSAMSTSYLGENFDIHGGGADLKFPHHENEIAQSCCANPGSSYAKYWLHNGFLTVSGEKMSKSLNNFITVRDLLDKGINPVEIRFLLLGTHYLKPLDFNANSMQEGKKFIEKAHKVILENKDLLKNVDLPEEILSYLLDDLNVSKAIAHMHRLLKNSKEDLSALSELYASMEFFDLFDQDYFKGDDVPEFVSEKLALIKKYRQEKNYQASDLVRDELLALGYELQFKPGGEIHASKKDANYE